MVKRLVGWLFLLPLSLVLVVFALANRQMVEINFDPLNTANPLVAPIIVPQFVVIYTMLLLGVVLGGLAVWITQGRNRADRRKWRNEARRLEAEKQAALQRSRSGTAQGTHLSDEFVDV